MKIFEKLKSDMPPEATYWSPIDFLMVVGDGREDEVIFRWANELGKDKTVANVTTVSLGSRNTEAGYTLTQGVTGTSTSPSLSLLSAIADMSSGVLTVLQRLSKIG
jgi:trehalose 6-phosphate synthase complex regulatory subunit